MSVIDDGAVSARLAGYSWPEINDHIDQATDTALAHGYTQQEVDGHLGYQDPGILQSKLSLGTPDTPPTISEDAPVDPGLAETYSNAIRTGLAKGPQEFAETLADQWGLDPESRDLLADKLPHPEDTIDHGIALSHMNGDGPDGALNAHHNLLDLWAQTGMTPQEVFASRDPFLIDALTKEPTEGPTLQEAEQLPKMPTLAELQSQVGRDAVSHFMGSEGDPIGLGGFVKDLYTLPAQRLDFDKETEEMRAAGKDISERWKDDPGFNFVANTLITGGVFKGAHVAGGKAADLINHPIIQDVLHDETGTVNIGKIIEVAGAKPQYTLDLFDKKELPGVEGLTEPRTQISYSINNREGKEAAAIDLTLYKDGRAHIDNINTAGEPEQGSNTLGPSVMRGLLRQLRENHPEITTLTGNRVSGAREGGVYNAEAANPVELRLPPTPETAKTTELAGETAKEAPEPQPSSEKAKLDERWNALSDEYKKIRDTAFERDAQYTPEERARLDEIDKERRVIAYDKGGEEPGGSYLTMGTAPEKGLVAAWRDGQNIYAGKPGDLHADVAGEAWSQHGAEAEKMEDGFVDRNGKFLNRKEALATLNEAEQSGLKVKSELDAADYLVNGPKGNPELAAEIIKPAIDEAVSKLGTTKAEPEPELILPEGIDKAGITEHVTELDHQFNLLRSNAAADIGESWNMLKAEPGEWMKPDFLSKVSREVEQRLGHDNPASVKLSPDVQSFLDAHKSLTDKQHALAVEEAQLLGKDSSGLRTVDEGHVHRIVKGEENLRGVLDPETYRDPITGARPRSLSKFDPGMKSRADMYVYEKINDAPKFERGKEPPIVQYRKEAKILEDRLPPPVEGTTRLWRGNRPDAVLGRNQQFTNDAAGIALPFRNSYGGDVHYVDVPTKDLAGYENKAGAAPGAEFLLPKEVAAQAKNAGRDFTTPGNRTWGRDPLEDTGHKMGDKVEDGLGKYTIKPARMDEIEANTKLRYRDNFLANLVQDVNERSRVVRNIKMIQAAQPELQADGLFEPRGTASPPNGMVKVDLPGMEGYAHPRIANVLNDFYQMAHERGSLLPYLNSATRAIMMSLFISPFKHLYNETAHFVPARGEEWVKPVGYGRLAMKGGEATQEVLGMGPQYIEYLRAGGTPLYVSARTKNFQQVMMTKFFHEQATDAGGLWSGLAKWSGFDNVKGLVQAEYNWSNRTLWAGGEMMRMQLYLERKAMGMSPAEAVAAINKDMPSYNIPTEVLLHNQAGHALSEFLKSPYAFVFGRYRYGQIATASNHIKDFVDPASDLTERRQAAAKIITTVGMYMGMAQLGQYAGIGTLIHSAQGIISGEKRWQDGIGSLLTLGPLLDIASMVKNNVDRTGKEIWRQGGTAIGNVVNAGKHAIGAFPVGQLAEELFKKGGTEKVLLKLLGWDEKTPIDPAKKAAFDQRAKAQALSAERKDDIETWVRNMLGEPLAAAAASAGRGGTPRATGGYVGSQGDGSYSGTGAGRGQRATGSYAGNGSGGTRASGLDSGGVVLRGSGGPPRQAGDSSGGGGGGGGIVLGDQQPRTSTTRSGGGRGGGRSRAAYYAARRRR